MPNRDSSKVEQLRQHYQSDILSIDNTANNPLDQFESWFNDALESGILEPNAMTLCTVSPQGYPQGRIVLLKGFSEEGFRFFTNYGSSKGNDLKHNPRASLVFFWDKLQRQVRISGPVEKLSEEASSAYFNKRPVESQLGAIASPQSQVIPSRKVLSDSLEQAKLDHQSTQKITKPKHWGGYLVMPTTYEFWQGQPSRLHDRIVYHKEENKWTKSRLAP